MENEMATHITILAWKITWTKEPGRPCSPWGREESDTTEWLQYVLLLEINILSNTVYFRQEEHTKNSF